MGSTCTAKNESGFCTLPDSHDPDKEPHVFGTEFADALAEVPEPEIYEYTTHEACLADGMHLLSQDRDGYCNYCGEQE